MMAHSPSPAGVVELLLPGEAAATAWWPLLIILGAAALALGAAACLAIRAWNRRDPLSSAFGKLAGAARLPRADRREVARVAAECGVPAAALLLVPAELERRAAAGDRARAVAEHLARPGTRSAIAAAVTGSGSTAAAH